MHPCRRRLQLLILLGPPQTRQRNSSTSSRRVLALTTRTHPSYCPPCHPPYCTSRYYPAVGAHFVCCASPSPLHCQENSSSPDGLPSCVSSPDAIPPFISSLVSPRQLLICVLVGSDGVLHLGVDAFPALWDQLPYFYKMSPAYRAAMENVPGFRRLMERG